MSKFTIFTVILAVSVITVMADLAIRDYLENQGLASVISATAPSNGIPAGAGASAISPVPSSGVGSSSATVIDGAIIGSDLPPATSGTSPSAAADTSLPPLISQPAPTFTQDVVSQAGFSGTLKEKVFTGKIFELLDITKVPVDYIGYSSLEENGIQALSITEIVLRDEIRALQLYSLLQNKTKPYIDLSLNETNAYGERSFYINHEKKKDEAFLTVKIKNRIYAFAYVKYFHPEIKKLIQLLNP